MKIDINKYFNYDYHMYHYWLEETNIDTLIDIFLDSSNCD